MLSHESVVMKDIRNRWMRRSRLFALTAVSIAACGTWAVRAQQTPQTQQAPAAQFSPQNTQAQQAPTAEPPQSSANVSVETKLVAVYATVRDKHGKIVPTLSKEDFALTQDGHPQTISYFARENDLPLTLGLLVDTSMSQARVLDSERDASFTFLDHMLQQDKDTAFVIHFDREVELLQDVTGSHPKLQAALKELAISRPDRDDQSGGNGRGYRGAGTLLYDSIYLASNEVMKKQKGRKAIFVLTDGNDRGSKETLETAIEAAQRADVSVYSIYFAGDEPGSSHGGYGHGGGMGRGGGGGWPGGGGGGRGGHYPQEERSDGKKVLQRLSAETGGRYFEISKKLPIDQAYAAVQEELRNQYSLGYTPNAADAGEGYHRIQVTVSQKDDAVQARDGYYSDH
jgi:VWFA-related protein